MIALKSKGQLKNVQQIQATRSAFCAILANRSIVVWGNPAYGGETSAVQDELRDVLQVQATCRAFAAILADGSVATWGDPHCGGDSSAVRNQLRTNVQQLQATRLGAFCRDPGRWSCCYMGRSQLWWR